jgi:hypothetical protein
MGLTIYLPFFQALFDTAPLPAPWLGFVALWLILIIMLVEFFKWVASAFFVDYDETE